MARRSTRAPSVEFDVDAALLHIAGKKHALICTHDNPDPDGMAAMEGLRTLLERRGLRATLALGGFIGRAENRSMVSTLAIPLVPMERIDPSSFDVIALIDTQPNAGNNSLPVDLAVDIVIDHHPKRSDLSLSIPWCDVRPGLGASSTIVLAYLKQQGIILDARLATAFLYAVKSETRDLGREASAAERSAYIELMALADHELLAQIVTPKVPREHFAALVRSVSASRVAGSLIVCDLGELDYPDLVAEIADLLMRYRGADFVLCAGHYDSRGCMSLRTDRKDSNAGVIMKRIVGELGTAGGHGMTAGAQLFARASRGMVETPSFSEIIERLKTELGITQEPFVKLYGSLATSQSETDS